MKLKYLNIRHKHNDYIRTQTWDMFDWLFHICELCLSCGLTSVREVSIFNVTIIAQIAARAYDSETVRSNRKLHVCIHIPINMQDFQVNPQTTDSWHQSSNINMSPKFFVVYSHKIKVYVISSIIIHAFMASMVIKCLSV